MVPPLAVGALDVASVARQLQKKYVNFIEEFLKVLQVVWGRTSY
jgi:hypothetical protein